MDIMGGFDGSLHELTDVGFRFGTFMSACLRLANELMMMRTGFVIAM